MGKYVHLTINRHIENLHGVLIINHSIIFNHASALKRVIYKNLSRKHKNTKNINL